MAGEKTVTFSPREMEVLALAWQCMESQPKLDIDKLARLTGYTRGSATVTFGKIKSKLNQLGDSLSAAPPPPITPKKAGGMARAPKSASKSTPKAGTKRTATASDTPSKRAKMQASSIEESEDELPEDMYAPIKKEKVEDDDEGEGVTSFFNQMHEYAQDSQEYEK